MFPVDETKYPVKRFDSRLVKRYSTSKSKNKLEDLVEELATSINTPLKLYEGKSLSKSPSTGVSDVSLHCYCKELGEKPTRNPSEMGRTGFLLVFIKKIRSRKNQVSTPHAETSFEELLLNKIAKPKKCTPKKKKKSGLSIHHN